LISKFIYVTIIYILKEKKQVANIKSQKDRIITNEIAHQANKAKKSAIATQIRKYKQQVTSGDFENAQKSLKELFSAIDRARLDNLYHANNANRKKASLASLLSQAQNKKA